MVVGSDAALQVLHARGRDTWPTIDLGFDAFSAVVARQIATLPVDQLPELHAGDLYLAIACALGDARAIALIDERYLSGFAPMLGRLGQDAASVEDVTQILRLRLLVGAPGQPPRISRYNGTASLATWLRVAAVRIAISLHRKHRAADVVDEVDVVAEAPSPELELLQRSYGSEFQIAFRAAFEALTARDRNLLRHQVVDKLGIDRTAALYRVHRATAARWIAQARDALVRGVRRELQDRLGVDKQEFESILRVLHSKLEISLRLFLTR